MPDAELRSALVRFFEDQNAQAATLVKALETSLEHITDANPVYDAIEGHLKFILHLQQQSELFLQTFAGEPPVAEDQPSSVTTLAPYELELVAAYNDSPGTWNRTFKPTGFGAENVNELWERGGEPRFARKEGGIYNLVEGNGVCYVVPEPGLRLQESYFRSEGLRYLFDVTGSSSVDQPLITLICPATVEEAGGRWNVLSKGEIRGRG